jgi:hypothetical protein
MPTRPQISSTPDMNRRTLRVRDCGTWSGSIDDIIATAAYLEKAGYQQEAGQHMARKAGTGYVQVLYRCSLTLIGKKNRPELVALTCIYQWSSRESSQTQNSF